MNNNKNTTHCTNWFCSVHIMVLYTTQNIDIVWGTHNSAATALDLSVNFWTRWSLWNLIRVAAKKLSCIRRRVVALTVCQDLEIKQQLEHGVRVLDLRVAYKDHTFYVAHTFACTRLRDVLYSIKSTLHTQWDEKVHLLIKPDYENRHTMGDKEDELVHLIHRTMGGDERVVVWYSPQNPHTVLPASVHDGRTLHHVWLNAQTVSEFLEKFARVQWKPHSVVYFCLTPDQKSVWTSSASIKSMAQALRQHVALVNTINPSPKFILVDYWNKNRSY